MSIESFGALLSRNIPDLNCIFEGDSQSVNIVWEYDRFGIIISVKIIKLVFLFIEAEKIIFYPGPSRTRSTSSKYSYVHNRWCVDERSSELGNMENWWP
jgi:hypothetical protein